MRQHFYFGYIGMNKCQLRWMSMKAGRRTDDVKSTESFHQQEISLAQHHQGEKRLPVGRYVVYKTQGVEKIKREDILIYFRLSSHLISYRLDYQPSSSHLISSHPISTSIRSKQKQPHLAFSTFPQFRDSKMKQQLTKR